MVNFNPATYGTSPLAKPKNFWDTVPTVQQKLQSLKKAPTQITKNDIEAEKKNIARKSIAETIGVAEKQMPKVLEQITPVKKPTIGNVLTPKANAGVSYLNELKYDIDNGATVEQILNAYPELKGDKKLAEQLHYDIKTGANIDQIENAYPELDDTPKSIEQPKQETFGEYVGKKIPILNNPIGKGISELIGGTYQAGENVFTGAEGLAQKGFYDIAGKLSGGKIQRKQEGETGNTGLPVEKIGTYRENALKIGAGLATLGVTGKFPVASGLFSVASETPGVKVIPETISKGFDAIAEVGISAVPGNEILTPEERQNLKSIIINSVVLKGGKKVDEQAILNQAKIKTQEVIKNPKRTMETIGEKIKPTRTTEEISGNILQPYKGMTENLADANKGLRRTIEETGISKDANYKSLLKNTNEVSNNYGKMLETELSSIPGTFKSESVGNALLQLENIYEGTLSKKNQGILNRVKELNEKNYREGLTALEANKVKILHTKANSMFNDKGQQTGGFTADDLRGIRSDIKKEIEDFSEKNGVTNIKEINKTYGELQSAKTLLENQIANATAYKGRQLPTTFGQKVGKIVIGIPGIKQLFSDPVRGILTGLGVSLRSDKINPIEVQKRLPGLLKELRKSGIKEGDLSKIEMQIGEALKLLPPPSGKSTIGEYLKSK